MAQDVFKILKDLEARIVGVDPNTKQMNEGFFAAFRPVGLPIHKEDFDNPYTPLGGNLEKDIPKTPPIDPKDATTNASSTLDENKIFTANIARSQQNYLNTFLLVDDKLRMNNEYSVMPGAGKVSDAWWAIITGANGIPEQLELNATIKKAYDDANAKLMDKDGNPTPHYQAYMQYEEAWRDKVKAWHRAYSNAMADPMKLQNWPIDGVQYQDEADEAMDRWNSFGFKPEIENAIAILAAQGTDPAIALISRAKKRYINSLNEFNSVGELPYTLMSPHSWYDKDNDDGWYQYSSTDFHSESHFSSSSTSYGGGGGFHVGFWSAGGGFENSSSQQHMEFQTDGLDISFQYCAVDIKRPWLILDLLSLKNWFLVGDYKKNSISTGTMAQEIPTNGVPQIFMPSVITTLILIKDLKIKWNNWKSQWDDKMSSTSASASVGWGPFAVQGHYAHHNQQRDVECDSSGEALSVDGIQLLGYVSMISPPCPGVDSATYMSKVQTPAATTTTTAGTA